MNPIMYLPIFLNPGMKKNRINAPIKMLNQGKNPSFSQVVVNAWVCSSVCTKTIPFMVEAFKPNKLPTEETIGDKASTRCP